MTNVQNSQLTGDSDWLESRIRQLVEDVKQMPDATTSETHSALVERCLAEADAIEAHYNAQAEQLAQERVREAHEALESMARQFAYETETKSGPALWHGGLSALEEAFDALGWESPHPVPELKCHAEGCKKFGNAGTPTPEGYKWLCGEHYSQLQQVKEDTHAR